MATGSGQVRCLQCGWGNPPQSRFCNWCGTRLAEWAAPTFDSGHVAPVFRRIAPIGMGSIWHWLRVARRRLAAVRSLEWPLFGASLLVYAVTRLWGLEEFPIYFFTDEAFHPLQAERLIGRGLRDSQGNFLPIYFEAAGQRWTPVLSVYAHVVSVALFGKTVLVTRATSAMVSLLGAVAVGLILRLVFRARYWWTSVLVVAITPAWFLHSRTAFETVIMASLFAWFLLFYLLYRTRSPRYLFPAVVAGAAAFYTYSNGQGIVVASAGLFFLSDLRYHLSHWRVTLAGALLAGVLALPLISFQGSHPVAMQEHLRTIDSYWFRSMPVQDKLGRFAQLYLYGLSPQYWFFPNDHDLSRHLMRGYGHLRTETLPLFLVGVGLCVWRWRDSEHRAVLLAAMAAPVSAALVGVGITRVLAFVVPACVLSVLGLELLSRRVSGKLPHQTLALSLLAALSLAGLWMLRDAVVEGPRWFRDYGLYGMQYGARQLFEQAIPRYLAQEPELQVMVSPTWANGTDNFPGFFLSGDQRRRVHMRNVDHYMSEKRDLSPQVLLVMTPAEYARALESGKFATIDVDWILPYPDGNPGFYFARLTYAENVEAILAAEREARRRLVEGRITIGGTSTIVHHSGLDAGQLKDMFDGDRHTLARGMEANPFVLEILFPEPRRVTGLAGDFGSMDFVLTARLYPVGGGEPVDHSETYRGLPPDPHVEMALEQAPEAVVGVRLEVRNLQAGETANVHIREIALR